MALIVLALVPVLYLLVLIAKYGVNVPYADDFMIPPLLVKAYDHTLTFQDLFEQHNEHRYFFPRLLFIAFARLADGNLRAEMFFSLSLTVLISANLWLLVRKTIDRSLGKSLVVLFLINLALFSPVQAENWTWGFQFPLFLCNFLFVCALAATASALTITKKFAICLPLAVVAIFSFGGGVLLWALTFPLALLTQKEMTRKSRIAWGAVWGCAGLGALALYFFHYVKPPQHPSLVASVNPLDYLFYVAAFLGAHLSRASRLEPILPAAAIGTVLLALYIGAVVYAWRRRYDAALTNRMLPWFALGAYAILNASLAAVARIGFGVNQALDSRYTSFSLFLSVALVGLLAILKKKIVDTRGEARAYGTALLRGETILLTAFAVLSLNAFTFGRGVMIESHRTRLWGKGALLFSNVLDSGELHDKYLIANAPEARACANMLDALGFMHPRMVPSSEISKLETKNTEAGYLDIVSSTGQTCSITGWAILPESKTPAHCVVLSYKDPERGAVAFRIADEIQERQDVAAFVENQAAETSGWICHFERSLVPPGDHLLEGWAFDADRGILYPLGTPRILH